MNQAILVHTDIHERPEVGDVGHRPFQGHPRLQVIECFHPFLEAGETELWPGVPPRFFQLGNDIPDGGNPELIGHILFRVQAPQETDITNQVRHLATAFLRDGFHHTVGLGMYGGTVQGFSPD